MRVLTSKQKKVLDKWIDSQRESDEWKKQVNDNAPFTKGRWVLNMEDLPTEIFDALEQINDTEILWQETQRYLHDKSWAEIE